MAYIPDDAVDRMTELSAGAWRLYCFLARCRNGKTGKCFPSVRVSAEAINVHPKNVFKLRSELATAGWAHFDGDHVCNLFGFDGSKNTTPDIDNAEDMAIGSKNATAGSKNATVRVDTARDAEISRKNATIGETAGVAKTLPNGSKNATRIKEEPAKLTSKVKPIGATAPDSRSSHVAIQTCRGITNRYPPKAIWDKLIQVLGDCPDRVLLVECHAEWVERGYNAASWKWATEWYLTGVPRRISPEAKKQNNAAYVGKNKPTVEEPMAEEMGEYIDVAIRANDLVYLAKLRDEILKRGAVHDWERKVLTFFEQPIPGSEPVTPAEMADLNSRIAALQPITRVG